MVSSSLDLLMFHLFDCQVSRNALAFFAVFSIIPVKYVVRFNSVGGC